MHALRSIAIAAAASSAAAAMATPPPGPLPGPPSTILQSAASCAEYRDLSVGAGVGTQTAIATSYRCGALNVDSTGASPAGTLITPTGMALEFAFGDAPDPTMVETRLYDGGGLTATFGR